MTKWKRHFYSRAEPEQKENGNIVKPISPKKNVPPKMEETKKCIEPKINTNDNGCPQLPGTFFRLNIKPGFVINLLNVIEISSPSGICLIFRLLP